MANISFSAATAIDIAKTINSVIICSDSLIAVLNLIIDNAPTSPSDNAKEVFITETISNIDNEKGINILEKLILLSLEKLEVM